MKERNQNTYKKLIIDEGIVKVGLIGYGKWGQTLKDKLDQLCEVVFITRSKDSYEEKLKNVEWVFVATPNETHYNIVKKCLLAKVNVFCEKPLTLSYKESKELFDLAKEKGVKLYVDNVFNFREHSKKLKENLENISHFSIIWKKSSEIKHNSELLYRLAYHHIYLFYELFKKEEVKDVKVLKNRKGKLQFQVLLKHHTLEFLYDGNYPQRLHTINNLNFDERENDALKDMLKAVLENKVNLVENEKQALFVNSFIDSLSKQLFKRVAVIGGGIFGTTIANDLSKEGFLVELFEERPDILMAASGINQYRIHHGYHYPRSKETALASKHGSPTFIERYHEAVLEKEHYYCIAKERSMTSKDEFLKVLKELDLPHVEESLQSIREENVELTVKVKEYLFDPEKLKKLCWEELTLNNVKVHLNTEIKSLEELKDFDFIIIASYAKLNSLLPQEEQRELQFELCEKPLFKLPEEYKNKSIVIMDGPFMCFDPYGESGYHLGGNVVHAIHSRNIGKAPVIPEGYEELLNNGIIKNPPKTKVKEFINSSKEFFHNLENIEHIGSMFTFRTVLPNREHDDSRPTLVSIINEKTFSVFSGKISTCVEASRKIIELLKQKEQTYNLDLIILHNRDHELDKSFE